MSSQPLGQVLRRIRKLIGSAEASAPDAALLDSFATTRDQQAFEDLVDRHANLVYSVCRRVLDDEEDAADAFQATFFVLARKAGSIRKQASVSSWLYGVAFRVSRKLRAKRSRRRAVEKQMIPMETAAPSPVVYDDLRRVLDEELDHLPEKYRDPLVLCYLEGQTHEQAAKTLGWPTGTMSRRIGRGLEWLRQRLARRGVTLSAVVLGTALVDQKLHAAAPAALMTDTVRGAVTYAAGTVMTGTAVVLADEMAHSLFVAKIRYLLVLAFGFTLVGTTAGVLMSRSSEAKRSDAPPPAAQSFEDGGLVARLDQAIDAFQPTPAERKIDQIGWARDIREAKRLARENARPVFLFTHTGRIGTGRCGGSAFNVRANGFADDRVIARLNRSYVPVLAAAEDYVQGGQRAEEGGEMQQIYHAARGAKLPASDECIYLLSSDGNVREVIAIKEIKSNAQALLNRLDAFVARHQPREGAPVVPAAPLSVPPSAPPEGLVLHLVARVDHRKPWGEFPAENWLVLSPEEVEQLLAGAGTQPGDSWIINPVLSGQILTHFYPQTENNDVSKNRLDVQELRATVVATNGEIVRARLDGKLRMKHRFYSNREDDSFVDATLVGAIDFEPASRRVRAVRLMTEHATYGRYTFQVVLRSHP
jgi:RNA polymerase sigma factor (sigma-70 family)